jgi:FAD/FMN-containing dehydrogenase
VTVSPPPASARARAEALRGLCGGAVHLPGDPGYDLARAPWNAQVESFPAAVAYPAFPDEVADVLRAAAAAGLGVAPQGTGHGAAPLEGRLGQAVLLRTAALGELSIDQERRVARVGAGVLWGDLADAAGTVGLAALHPSSPDVGVVGYSIGGGIGWYARRLGLQCNAVTAVEVVLADGTFVRATADRDAELFWGLRGSGVPLGVVTALEFRLFEIDTAVAGFLAWDAALVDRVLPAWVAWCAEAPDEATTAFRLLQAPDAPSLPAQVRGRRLVVIDGSVLGPDERTSEILAPLRALGPEIDTIARVPAPALVRMHLEPEGPSPAYASSALLTHLPDAAVAAVLEAAGPGSGNRLTVAELRQLGGALGRPDPAGGALDRLAGEFLVLGLGLEEDPATWPGLRQDAARLLDALRPWHAPTEYLPMLDDVSDRRRAYPPAVYTRLAALRRAVDPDGLFVGQHA